MGQDRNINCGEGKRRCGWEGNKEFMVRYHDEEWGVPLFDDRRLFEFVILDGFQAGLSWEITLKKRDNFRRAFDDYDIGKMARWDDEKVASLLSDPGIIRNRLKISAARTNARAFLALRDKGIKFSEYLWAFTNGETLQNSWKSLAEVPVSTAESDAMSRQMKKDGFKFVGTTICYAFMQAAGMVNDHLVSCYRHAEVKI